MNRIKDKILIVDDEEIVRESIGAILEDAGYSIQLACNGKEGMEQLNDHEPDLLISDLTMPVIDGFQLLEHAVHIYPQMPVIVISGAGAVEQAVKAVHKGAWDYLVKPVIDMDALIHSVQKAIERSHLIKENTRHQHQLEELVESRTHELKGAYKELQTAHNSLSKKENYYRKLLERSNDIITVMGPDGTVRYQSPSVKRILGYEAGTLTGSPYTENMHNDDKMRFNETIRQIRTEQQSEATVVFRFRDSQNAWRTIESIIRNLSDDDSINSILMNSRDITERCRLESQLRHAQKMEAIGALAGGVAHDFNNILQAIQGFSDLALTKIDPGSQAHMFLEQVLIAGERAGELIKQILTFSRPNEQERKNLKMQPIIKETLKFLRSSLPSTIKISENIETDCPSVYADPTQIHQIIMNLSTNAFHPMQENGGTLKVSLKSENIHPSSHISPQGLYLHLTIADTGYGMPTEVREHIFEPFFTTKGPGEGTGLGLATTHGIVREYGGHITVNSAPGEGTKFDIYLPAIQEQEEEETATPDMPEELKRGTESIMFVDDEVTLTELAKNLLSDLGYQISAFTDSTKALKTFQSNPDSCDILITDYTMPDIRGDELIAETRKIKPDIPVILCSGFRDQLDQKDLEDINVNCFLNKPFTTKEITEAVRRCLDRCS